MQTHTFLFADLVGFTALSLERGDEEAADIATRFHREVSRLAGQHGATVVKSLGDGAMVLADDACEALHMGVELVNGLDGLPAVRVGMNTGPAVEREGDWYGSTVNLAARLGQAARGGEVLLSEATREAAKKHRPRLEQRGPRRLRSTREPVVVYAALPADPGDRRLARLRARWEARVDSLAPRFSVFKERFQHATCPKKAARLREAA